MSAPRVLLDMDGPLADFDALFWDRCTASGVGFDIEHPSHQRHRFFTEHISDPTQRKAARTMVNTAGWFRDLPLTPGAQEGVEALFAAGLDVWVCTKPLEVNPTCRDEKGAWLRQHFPDLERKLIIAPDKSLIVGDVLLDDAPKPEWIPVATWLPVIFSTPFNGDGSDWGELPHWSWGDPIASLLPGHSCGSCGEIAELIELPTAPDWADNTFLCEPCADNPNPRTR